MHSLGIIHSELVDEIVYDYGFEEFWREHSNRLNVDQLAASEGFTAITDRWYERTPTGIIDSPDWIKVREAAAAFVRAFSPES
jgi:hypothetical protein